MKDWKERKGVNNLLGVNNLFKVYFYKREKERGPIGIRDRWSGEVFVSMSCFALLCFMFVY